MVEYYANNKGYPLFLESLKPIIEQEIENKDKVFGFKSTRNIFFYCMRVYKKLWLIKFIIHPIIWKAPLVSVLFHM